MLSALAKATAEPVYFMGASAAIWNFPIYVDADDEPETPDQILSRSRDNRARANQAAIDQEKFLAEKAEEYREAVRTRNVFNSKRCAFQFR